MYSHYVPFKFPNGSHHVPNMFSKSTKLKEPPKTLNTTLQTFAGVSAQEKNHQCSRNPPTKLHRVISPTQTHTHKHTSPHKQTKQTNKESNLQKLLLSIVF
jgi:hypothetical protein